VQVFAVVQGSHARNSGCSRVSALHAQEHSGWVAFGPKAEAGGWIQCVFGGFSLHGTQAASLVAVQGDTRKPAAQLRWSEQGAQLAEHAPRWIVPLHQCVFCAQEKGQESGALRAVPAAMYIFAGEGVQG